MLKDLVTIVIPVKEDPKVVEQFILWNRDILMKLPVIVVDSGGGGALKVYASEYIKTNIPFWEARKKVYKLVNTEYIFNLDCDAVPGTYYLTYAMSYLEDKDVGAVSTFFWNRSHKGKLEYGVSIWRTFILQKVYDYSPIKMPRDNRLCECIYMWDKLEAEGYKLRPSRMFAMHINKEGGKK